MIWQRLIHSVVFLRSIWRSRVSFAVRTSSSFGADAKNTCATFSFSRISSYSARPRRSKEDTTSTSTNSPSRYRIRVWCVSAVSFVSWRVFALVSDGWDRDDGERGRQRPALRDLVSPEEVTGHLHPAGLLWRGEERLDRRHRQDPVETSFTKPRSDCDTEYITLHYTK